MSSIGQALGGIVGGAIGFMVGGPSLALKGAQLGIMAGGFLDPPKGPVINGPRLDDLSVQTSTYGAFIPRNYGTVAQNGNVFWLMNDRLTEVKTTTTSGGKGGPTQTTNTFSYYASFAVGLCQGPIDGVRRIWIGSDLFYDAGSDDLASIIASNQNAGKFALYTGTDTQAASPLIQADKGAANVPAYRGLAYIVFDTLPLENYGNSLAGAQVKVEVVKDASFLGPRLVSETEVDGYPYSFYPRPILSALDGVLSIYGYDIYGGTTLIDGDYVPNVQRVMKIRYDGTFIASETVPSGILYPQTVSTGTITTRVGTLGNNDVWWPEYSATYAIGNGVRQVIPWGEIGARNTTSATGSNGDIADALPGESGRYVIGIAISNDSSQILITTYSANRISNNRADRYFILDSNLDVLKSGSISGSWTDIWSISGNTSESVNGVVSISSDDYSGWLVNSNMEIHYFYVDSSNVLQISAKHYATNIAGITYPAATYQDGLFYILWRSSSKSRLDVYTAIKTITSASAFLGDVVQAECMESNLLQSADLDVTELTDMVRGYRVSSAGAIRGAIDPLRAAWPFDVVQHGYKIKFKARGSASIATIPASDLDARAAGDAGGVQITDVREMDLILPRRVTVQYLDTVREYDINSQYAERINTDAVNEHNIDLPIVFTGAEAAQKAEVLLYLYWLERYDISFVLPPSYAQLEPGDTVTVVAEMATYELRLTGVNTLPDGRLECRAKYNSAAVYTPTAVGEDGQSTGYGLTIAGPSAYALLDIPLMRDDDDTAGFPVAMTGYLNGWPGGILYRSDDSGQTWTDLVGFVSPGSVIGYATGSLGSHIGTSIDFSSSLAVRIYSGSLSSVTQQQMFSGQNWFAYGADGRWEIIAAQNAVLQGDGSYVMSDFLRGQRGTEWATGLHAAGDTIVLLDQSALAFVSVNSSSIGMNRAYRGITVGKALDSDSDMTFSYDAVNLECLSPCHLTGSRNPSSNTWTLEWTRRSRYGDWRDYVDAPLGEASESYEVDIFSDGTYTTLKRTLTSSTQTVDYSSANQVTDFGSNQSTLYLKVYQLSASVGRGYPLTASITR